MDLRQIRCFIAVAEELHFRRAAERVGLAQTALSAQVKRLEEELGFPLFFRTTRHVSLTQAGAIFLEDTRALLDQLDRAIETARSAATSGLDRLRIGGIDAALVWFLPPVFKAFHALHPGIRLPLTEVSASAIQVEELTRHRIDLAFFRPPVVRDGITWELLFDEGVFVAVAADDPLAQQDVIAPAELAARSLIGYPRHARPYLAAMVENCLASLPVAPATEMEVLDKSTLLRLVGQGTGVGLVPQWTTEIPVDGVRFVRLQDAPRLQFGVAWRERDTDNATLRDFLQLARAEAAKVQARFS